MEKELETWENSTRGRIGVLKFDRRGDLRNELVRPGQKVHLTVDERKINQERAANDGLDVFQNGHLTPVRLIDGTEDAHEIASNPNLMSESDLRDLFKKQWKAFESKVKTVTNPITLQRLLALAEDEDVNATVKQVSIVKSQIAEVSGVAAPVEAEPRTDREFGGLTPTTPK